MTFRHVWPFRKNTAGIRVLFAGIGWETSTELSTTQPSSYRRVPATSGRLPMQAETWSFALSRKTGCWDTCKTVYSNGPILYRYLVIGCLVATSKASMRSVNRDRDARGWRIVPETKPTLRFSVPRVKRNPHKLTASKYQYHASVYNYLTNCRAYAAVLLTNPKNT